MYDRIIVPLDGSDLAENALDEAIRISHSTGDPLYLLRVVDHTNLHGYGPYGLQIEYISFEAVVEEEENVSRDYLSQKAEKLRSEEDILVETGVVRGHAARAILSSSSPEDLIVMASHGRGGISRWLLGSVAEDVVRHSEAPVLVVRAKNGAKLPANG